VNNSKKLRHRVETKTETQLDYIGSPLNIAEENLLDDGEYNYNVRTSLVQLQHAVEDSESDLDGIREQIKTFRDELADKALLPPQDQIKR